MAGVHKFTKNLEATSIACAGKMT